MPEIRTDPISGRQVIMAPERADRPFEHSASPAVESLDHCPFCAGNEEATPEAVLTLPAAHESPDWRVRIVPNRYPAVGEKRVPAQTAAAKFETSAAPGRHEVIIESPDHETCMHRLNVSQFELILRAWRQRVNEIRDEESVAHATLFKNDGAAAGASLEHVHSQLLTTPFIPPAVEEQLSAGTRFHAAHSRNAWLETLEWERAVGDRIVSDSDDFVAYCPFASRFPAETWIVPRRHCPDFADSTDTELSALAPLLQDVLERIDGIYPDSACNLVMHTAPFIPDDRRAAMQWHLQITPRLTGIAGFEIGAGSWVNIVAPEDAAARLRAAVRSQ